MTAIHTHRYFLQAYKISLGLRNLDLNSIENKYFPFFYKILMSSIKVWIFCIFFHFSLEATLDKVPSLIELIMNPNSLSLINSVDFHPKANRFCVTYTYNQSVVIYQLNKDRATIFQVLKNPSAKLGSPQHALFSKEGQSLVVVNWYNQTFNVYQADLSGVFQNEPIAVIPFYLPTSHFRPHGMAFSPDGNYLAVAYGATKQDPKAIAFYRVKDLQGKPSFKLLSLLQENEIEGIPKGIVFSPDGSSLLVTFSNTNSVAIYAIDFSTEKILSPPRQILKDSKLARPEDIKFTSDGNFCAISNSSIDTVTFYRFDKENNYFTHDSPIYILKNPEANLSTPHGLAFSSDGNYFVVTQFGPVRFDTFDNLFFCGTKRMDSVAVYKLLPLSKKNQS